MVVALRWAEGSAPHGAGELPGRAVPGSLGPHEHLVADGHDVGHGPGAQFRRAPARRQLALEPAVVGGLPGHAADLDPHPLDLDRVQVEGRVAVVGQLHAQPRRFAAPPQQLLAGPGQPLAVHRAAPDVRRVAGRTQPSQHRRRRLQAVRPGEGLPRRYRRRPGGRRLRGVRGSRGGGVGGGRRGRLTARTASGEGQGQGHRNRCEHGSARGGSSGRRRADNGEAAGSVPPAARKDRRPCRHEGERARLGRPVRFAARVRFLVRAPVRGASGRDARCHSSITATASRPTSCRVRRRVRPAPRTVSTAFSGRPVAARSRA